MNLFLFFTRNNQQQVKMEHINDKNLINECNNSVKILLNKGMPIDMVCKLIKGYQRIYILMKQQEPHLASEFKFDKYIELVKEKKCILDVDL